MGNKVGVSMITLTDLNDAIIAGTAPTNPSEGTLWIDSSLTPPVLKKWSMGTWVRQAMDLQELDPEYTEYISQGVENATLKLGNLSSDDKITATERQVILDKLTDMLGSSPTGTVALPAVATVNTYTVGEYYQTRKSATDAGVTTSDTAYTAYATAYTTLSNYLNTIIQDGIYSWDVSNLKADTVHTVVGQTFRDNWKAFYQAQLVLQTRTSKRVTDAKAEAELYTKSYREQLVGNGYAGVASNRNFSGFTYSTAQKVTGPGSFLRTATGETRTDEFIAVEPDRTYRLMVSVISSTTTGTHNIGLECYNAAGTSIAKRHLIRTSANSTALPSTTSFVHYENVISGLNIGAGSVSDTDFPAGTTQVKIYFNTNVGTTTNTLYVADVSFALENIEANKDYNGLSLSALKGMVITSTRNIAEFNATDGIKIYKKTDAANPVFKLDSNTGDLTITGNINMTGGAISWANITPPTATQVGAATPTDVSNAVKNIEIGGRNLLLNSRNQFLWGANNTGKGASVLMTEEATPYYRVTATAGNTISLYLTLNNTHLSEMPVAGEMYILSLDVRYTEDSLIVIYDSQSTVPSRNSKIIPANKWTRISTLAYASPAGVIMVQPILTSDKIGVDIRNLKYEKGNKATEWSPAPEDTATAIENVQVGGTNLFLNSDFKVNGPVGSTTNKHPDLYAKWYSGYNGGITNPTTSYHAHVDATTFGYPVIEYNESDGTRQWKGTSTYFNPLGSSGEYVFSVDIYTTLLGSMLYGGFHYRKKNDTVYGFYSGQFTITPTIAGGWKRYSIKVTLNDDVDLAQAVNFYMYGHGFSTNSILYMKNIQLEKGNKATEWSPAPEDSSIQLNALRSAAAATGLITVVDATTVQTGKVTADFIEVKGLTVSDGTKNTFRVDTGGNVTIDGTLNANSSSNVYQKTTMNTYLLKANPIGIGAKFDFGTFSAAATNKIYMHGYSLNTSTGDQQAADVDGYFYSYDNTTKVTAFKGVLDLTSGVTAGTEGYVIYDSTANKWGFAVYDINTQTWKRFNVADATRHNVALTWATNIYVVGEVIL